MQTGQRLHKLRTQANMTQEQLAEKLFVSRDLISKWENSERRPDYKSIVLMAEIFSVSPDDIIERNEILLRELAECIPENIDPENFEIEAVLSSFLRTLPVTNCGIFIRRYYHMENTSEIAGLYGLSDGNVRIILHRTRKKLKKYLLEVFS